MKTLEVLNKLREKSAELTTLRNVLKNKSYKNHGELNKALSGIKRVNSQIKELEGQLKGILKKTK